MKFWVNCKRKFLEWLDGVTDGNNVECFDNFQEHKKEYQEEVEGILNKPICNRLKRQINELKVQGESEIVIDELENILEMLKTTNLETVKNLVKQRRRILEFHPLEMKAFNIFLSTKGV